MTNLSYRLKHPQDPRSCVVFSSPHSGSEYSAAFLADAKLDMLAIRSSEDAFVDELFATAPDHGSPLLSAMVPRAFVDLNRAADELDPALILGARTSGANPRIAAGLGVIPRVVGGGQVIRTGKMSLREARQRISTYYTPYHTCLEDLLRNHRERHGMAILIDCHSMPSEALQAAPLVNSKTPDIVLGDRFGASSDRWISDRVREIFEGAGFRVARNAPFAGGYITKHYGRPSRGIHALQIEIHRSVYMNEANITRHENFADIQNALDKVTSELAMLGPRRANIAAE